MTPEEQRIAIAEACGWKITHIKGLWSPRPMNGRGNLGAYETRKRMAHALPDYLNDLNACHEMEKVLEYQEKLLYIDILYDVSHGYNASDNDGYLSSYFEVSRDSVFPMVTATAPQRCEAFLRTLNLWKDPQPKE